MNQASSATGGEGEAARQPQRRTRPRELEDGLNFYIYHPLSFRLALALRPTGITPNAVSLTGALLIVLAGAAYAGLSWPVSALIGFLFHASWHVVDGADGDLARMTGKSSPFGEVVDGLCDYGGHFILYTLLAWLLAFDIGGWAWAIATAAGVSRIFQSNHAETQKRTYLWWAYGVPWLKTSRQAGGASGSALRRFAEIMGGLYVAIANSLSASDNEVDGLLGGRGHDRATSEATRPIVRRIWSAPLAFEKLLGANDRTLLLGLSMAAGSPLWFFLAEIIPMNLLLIVSLRVHDRCARRLAAALRRDEEA